MYTIDRKNTRVNAYMYPGENAPQINTNWAMDTTGILG